ncbi:hypothetical protein [Spirillospora sp. CA-294931]|uniref:hypothetical protein n=1 Tax=Spirillospora sp. CA-294931 TaxID=3240042 RepID=UPI003D8FD0DC
MTNWSLLSHAYGSAEDVPELLDQAVPDQDAPVWDDLWSRLCHQGTVYTASFAALPVLTRRASEWSAADRLPALFLCGAIAAGRDGADPDIETTELIELTEESLRHAVVSGAPSPYVSLLQTLLAFEGVEVWSEHLEGILDEEYELACPHCESENYVVFGEHGYFSTTDDMYMKRKNAKRLALHPAAPSELRGIAHRLHTRALTDGFPDIAATFTYVFGTAHCAECETPFQVDEAITAHWTA